METWRFHSVSYSINTKAEPTLCLAPLAGTPAFCSHSGVEYSQISYNLGFLFYPRRVNIQTPYLKAIPFHDAERTRSCVANELLHLVAVTIRASITQSKFSFSYLVYILYRIFRKKSNLLLLLSKQKYRYWSAATCSLLRRCIHSFRPSDLPTTFSRPRFHAFLAVFFQHTPQQQSLTLEKGIMSVCPC